MTGERWARAPIPSRDDCVRARPCRPVRLRESRRGRSCHERVRRSDVGYRCLRLRVRVRVSFRQVVQFRLDQLRSPLEFLAFTGCSCVVSSSNSINFAPAPGFSKYGQISGKPGEVANLMKLELPTTQEQPVNAKN